MIQVLKRSDDILRVIAESPGIVLKDIVKKINLNKTTIFNILKSLCELGFLKQSAGGAYDLGDRFLDLSSEILSGRTVAGIAQNFAVELAEKTCESGMVVVLRKNELIVIAKHIYAQGIIVNTSLYGSMPREKTASGRVFIAYLNEKRREEFSRNCFLDMNEADRIKQLKLQKNDIADIRKRGIAVQTVYDREAYALAVPVFDQKGEICAALGVNLPAIRFKAIKEKEIEKIMKEIALRMGETLGFALRRFE